jgi:hypothetical protein
VIFSKPYRTAFVAVALLLVGALIFRDFLFRDKLLLYKDVGGDSLNFYYPYFLHLSDYVRSNGLPSWSFNVGMGQSLFPYVSSLLFDPVMWLPKNAIAHALVYQHLLKVLVCGMFFFRFLELRRLNYAASLLGALFVSFSAYMCMGSCWTNFGNEVVGFAFLLFASEKTLACGRWIYLPFAVASLGLLTVFHLYLCALLVGSYVFARIFEVYGWKLLPSLRVCAQLAVIALIGIGLAAVVWLDSGNAVLNSPRGSRIASYVNKLSSFPVFGLEVPLHYFTALLRQFSNDMVGVGSYFAIGVENYFRGWHNYFEAPMSYCGLLCLLILPQIFVGAAKRQRILYVVFLAFIIVPVVFPWFRYLFWLFQGDYYRTFSLFSVFGIVTLSMTAFSRYIEERTLNLWLLVATLLLLLAILFLPIPEMQSLINRKLRNVATLLLLAYTILIAAGRYSKRQSFVGWVIVALCAIELCYFDRITVANRPTVTRRELHERVGYNDYTVDAVRDIKATDKSFYRITKLYSSGPAVDRSFNDALVFDYYGTTSFCSFNNVNYIKFLMAVDAIPPNATEPNTRWVNGLLGQPLLSTFACEKYALTRNPVPWQVADDYQFLKRYGTAYLFQNRLFLPFGLTFNRYIPEEMFLQLPRSDKPLALLHAAVLSEQVARLYKLPQMTLEELKQEMSTTSLPDMIATRRAAALIAHAFRQTRIDGTVRLDENSVLVLQTPFDIGWHAFEDGRPAPVFKVDAGLLGVALNQGEHAVQLRYRPPFVATGAAVTLASLLILVASLWRWPRIRLPDET